MAWALAALLGACAPAVQPPQEPAAEASTPRVRALVGTAWLVEDIDSRGVVDYARTTLVFESEQRVVGSGGCNRYFAALTSSDDRRVDIGPAAATRKACPAAVMDQETRFLQALQSVRTYRLKEGGIMLLFDAEGRQRLRLSRIDTATAPPPGARTSPGSRQALTDFVFTCRDGPEFILRTVNEGTVEVELPEQVLRLKRERSASGAKYRHDDMLVWIKGQQAVLGLGGGRYRCTEDRPQTLLASARARGVEFRATGNEPGWVLEIFAERMQLDADYGMRRVTTPRPRARRDASGATVLHAVTEAHDLRVRIEADDCRDSMSGRPFPSSVTVELDGRRYQGCGQYLSSSSQGGKGTF